jgi:hypothetical protein
MGGLGGGGDLRCLDCVEFRVGLLA